MRRFTRNVAILIGLGLVGAAGGYAFRPASDEPAQTTVGEAPSGHDHGGESATLSDAKLTAAGIVLEKAGPAVLHDTLRLNGIVQPNQEALVQVSPRFPGVVRELRKRIGDRVEKGDLLATVESNQSLTTYDLRAPIAGTIIDRQAALGEYVSEQKPTFIIADLSTAWVDLSVYRRDFARVRVGDTVVLDPGDGGPAITTKVSYVSPIGTSDTQSALARVVVDNKDLRLRPGIFVAGRLQLTAKPVEIAIRSEALQTFEDRTVVFVRNGEKFEPRDVEIGDRDSDYVQILFGLMPNDVYAAKNSFVIKAELAKGAASHEH
ncbi:efflux RND transporter periplasmic adaptor subunit [Microbacteriaceae bacterium K1510]|nr:efflux RND transporter periplasmic adaptor subunit [Microbacteriaceae bacterium K1510]